jgi:hypothetical protein
MRPVSIIMLLIIAGSAAGQSSIAACGPLPDSTSRQWKMSIGDIRVCLVATKVADTDAASPAAWAARGNVVVLETQRAGNYRRAAITGGDVTWTINGQAAPVDSLADRWQTAVVEALDASFESYALRRQAADLQSLIDSLPRSITSTKQRIIYLEERDRELNVRLLYARDPATAAAVLDQLRILQPRQGIALLRLQLANLESLKVEDLAQELKALDAPQRQPALNARADKASAALRLILCNRQSEAGAACGPLS